MGHTCTNGPGLKKWVTLGKRGTHAKIGHTSKHGSQVNEWVTQSESLARNVLYLKNALKT